MANTHKSTSTYAVCVALSAFVFQANAETVGGSGAPIIELKVTDENRAIVTLNEGTTLAIGSAALEQGYAELPLDAFNSEITQSDWGKAEVLLGCGVADVLIYQQVDGQWQEHSVQQVSLDICVE